MNALVINDDPEVLYRIKEICEDNGVTVTAVRTRAKAFEEIELNRFDCIIVDYWVEHRVMDTFIDTARTWFDNPLIILTCNEDNTPSLKKRLNADFCIDVTVDLKSLSRVIEKIFKKGVDGNKYK